MPAPRPFGPRVSYLHISKVGGASIVSEFRDHRAIPNFYPRFKAGQEHTLLFDRSARPGWDRFTFLRNPRAHVWAMYTECKYDSNWNVAYGTDFPLGGVTANGEASTWKNKGPERKPYQDTPSQDVDGFRRWVHHFVAHPDTAETFKCYHPLNYQSQYFTLDWRDHPSNERVKVPNQQQALQNMLGLGAIGILEFFSESVCLIYSHIDGGRPRIDQLGCRCTEDGRDPIAFLDPPHVSHHRQGKRHDYDFEPGLMQMVDELTKVDRAVYRQALAVFFCRMRAFEAWLGRRVLCDSALEKQQHQLRFIEPNLLARYTATTPCHH